MFRDGTVIEGKKPINCVLVSGGIGDLLCSLMAVDYILKNCPWLNVTVWCPDYMKSFSKNVLPENTVVYGLSEMEGKFDDSKTGITTRWQGQHTPMRTHPVKYAFHVLADYDPKPEETNYLKVITGDINIDKFDLPENYVVIQGAYTEKVKTMPVETFNRVKSYCISKGYDVVVLGKTSSDQGVGNNVKATVGNYDFQDTINLIDETNLLESTKIIAESKALVAVDGGLVHVGGFTNTPLVVGYTFVNPDRIMPIRNNVVGHNVYPVVPDESLKCRGCQSNVTLLYGHEFRGCLYKDFECVNHMTADKFIAQLEKIL